MPPLVFHFFQPLATIQPLVFSFSLPGLLSSPWFSLSPTLGYYSALGFHFWPALATIQPWVFHFFPSLAVIPPWACIRQVRVWQTQVSSFFKSLSFFISLVARTLPPSLESKGGYSGFRVRLVQANPLLAKWWRGKVISFTTKQIAPQTSSTLSQIFPRKMHQ